MHALAQVASFALRAPIPPESLKRALNRTLPSADTRDRSAGRYQVRFTPATPPLPRRMNIGSIWRGRRTRRTTPSSALPFLARYVYSYPWPLDFEALQEAAQRFLGTHDFLSFAATDPDAAARSGRNPIAVFDEDETGQPGAIRTIFKSGWESRPVQEAALFVYHVRGSGFLHHMVRNLVGTMLDVGRGYRRADKIPAILAACSRAAAGPPPPARGLFLHSVEYPPEQLSTPVASGPLSDYT